MNKKQTAIAMRNRLLASAPKLQDPDQAGYVDAIIKRQVKMKSRKPKVVIA